MTAFDWTDIPTWEGAACKGQGDLFFTSDPTGQTTRQAKAICRHCPMQGQCLDYALADLSMQGIWGGTTERDRRIIRKSRGLAVRQIKPITHGTMAGYRAHERRGEAKCEWCIAAMRQYRAVQMADRHAGGRA